MPENPWVDPRPFVLGPDEARVVFVLVHGFTGAPAEVRPLGERLADRGHRVIGVQLPGHGTTIAALEGVEWTDWLEAVFAGIDWAAETADRIVLVGLSMGGLLCTIAAARDRRVDALALLAPAFRVKNKLIVLAGVGRWLVDTIPAPNLPRGGLTSTDGWKRLWHYEERPLDAVWELRKLQRAAWRALPRVKVKTLVAQGRLDQTLSVSGAEKAMSALGSEEKRLLWLQRSGHIVTADVELDDVVGAVEELGSSASGEVSSASM